MSRQSRPLRHPPSIALASRRFKVTIARARIQVAPPLAVDSRTFSSSCSVHRSRRMLGLTLCRQRCAHCCPVLVPIARPISLHLFPCSLWSINKLVSSSTDHGLVSRELSRGMETRTRARLRNTKSHATRCDDDNDGATRRARARCVRFVGWIFRARVDRSARRTLAIARARLTRNRVVVDREMGRLAGDGTAVDWDGEIQVDA